MTPTQQMSYRLFNDHLGIPGGWRYRIPETGILIKTSSYWLLSSEARKHYAANAIPVPAILDDLILEYVCKNGASCEYDGVQLTKGTPKKSLNISDVIRFTQTRLDALLKGSKVSQEEANRRAEICAACPSNKPLEGCTGCNSRSLREFVRLLAQAGRTPLDEQLKSCEYCGCFIQSMVWTPLESLKRYDDVSQLPSNCWKTTP